MAISIFWFKFIIFSFLMLAFIRTGVSQGSYGYVKAIDAKELGLAKEKVTHFHFYVHDTITGTNTTSVRIVQPPSNASATGFGFINVMDDPITERPEVTSKMIGRVQGIYGSTSQTEFGLIMAMNFAFSDGKYNGSTISVLGRNMILSKVRELPVIGGSGVFRFAKGYVQVKTYYLNFKLGNAILEYDIYVLHY